MLNFEPLQGPSFERLVFAFHCRRWAWKSIEWRGQLGDDGGRDIVGVREDALGRLEKVVVACANYRRLTFRKVKEDLEKIVSDQSFVPDVVRVVVGGAVSRKMRERCRSLSSTLGMHQTEIWSGVELEEQLRMYAPSVLMRMFEGVPFPDAAEELRAFTARAPVTTEEGLSVIVRIFQRPAFRSRLQRELELPAFRVALGNTIEALNTGLWKNRDGVLIDRIPSRHDFADLAIREALGEVVELVDRLRAAYDEMVAEKHIKACSCGRPDCSVFEVNWTAELVLERCRSSLMSKLDELFGIRLLAR